MKFRNPLKRLKRRRFTVPAAVAGALAMTVYAASPASAMYIDYSPGEIGSGWDFNDSCRPGNVCVWESLIVVGPRQPDDIFSDFGTYIIGVNHGDHTIWNNQLGDARVQFCTDMFGMDCPVTLYPGQAAHGSIAEYRSMNLVP
ncbi:hypothetical protein [Streptomyces sp. URMC 129]|uniref:hypothetical protein n=1 Tax=Streptomyces sp. URMC 129 TaxID=3423407 RepID=UPI003F1AC1D8